MTKHDTHNNSSNNNSNNSNNSNNDDSVQHNISHRTAMTESSLLHTMDHDGDDGWNDKNNNNNSIEVVDEDEKNTGTTCTSTVQPQSQPQPQQPQPQHNMIIDPPMTTIEQYRDIILRTLDLSIFQYIGILIIFGIIIDGAIFFFLLIGAHRLCDGSGGASSSGGGSSSNSDSDSDDIMITMTIDKTDCEPRNTIYNISIQILNGFFTYMAIMSLPWRLSNFLHVIPNSVRRFICCGICCCTCSCCNNSNDNNSNNNHHQSCYPSRKNDIGYNLYGIYDTDIWFHIPIRRRLYIIILLLCNCLFQFMNHTTRIIYSTYIQQDTYPGNIYTSVFFISAFICAGIGASLILYETNQLRQTYPNQFGYGPIDTIKHLYQYHFIKYIQEHNILKKSNTTDKNKKNRNKNVRKNETNIVDEEEEIIDVDDVENSDMETNTNNNNNNNNNNNYDEMENAFHHRERIHSLLQNENNERQQQQQQDPTRAQNHPTILLEDRGAMRMFGM